MNKIIIVDGNSLLFRAYFATATRMSTNQNGNSELVSAISDLKKSLNTRTGDTYNIDGITYDDGSNIATAVQSIVRAARMERRV